MRTVMCFGDSNTHGTGPRAEGQARWRYGPDRRWPRLMAERLGPGWHVVEEGLPGRTTVHPDPIEGAYKSGIAVLPALLESHRPLDAVIVMLGTNDLKARFSVTPRDIGSGVERIGRLIVSSEFEAASGPGGAAPRLLLVAPPPILAGGPFDREESRLQEAGAYEKSTRMGTAIEAAADRLGAAFLDAAPLVECSPVDGVHYAAQGHVALAEAIGDALVAMMGE